MRSERARRHTFRWLHPHRRDPRHRTEEVGGLTRIKPADDRHEVRARLRAVTRGALIRRPGSSA
jgi:hypothetical protein